MSSCRRVAWVATHPIQYHAPVFRQLTGLADLELEVLFLTSFGTRPSHDPQFDVVMQWDTPLLDGYAWRVLAPEQTDPHRFFGLRAAGIRRALAGGRFDAVVIAGWNNVGYVQTAFAAHSLGVRVIYLSDSNLLERERSRAVRAAKRAFFAALIRKRDHGLAVGRWSREYLEHIGIRPENIHDYPHCVDTSLTDRAWPDRAAHRAARRKELGIGDDVLVVLFSGKLIPKKDPLGLLAAFERSGLDAHLVYVGSGELERELRRRSAANPRVHLLGFKNQTALPAIYAAADVAVLPSVFNETWGLAVNETMAMGCVPIVSDRVGCSEDLVRATGVGVVYPAGDVEALAQAMRDVAGDPARLARWREGARRAVAGHTPARAAEGVREAVWAP